MSHLSRLVPVALLALIGASAACRSLGESPPLRAQAGAGAPRAVGWKLVHHEAFNRPFEEPERWVEDTYGASSPYHVDAFDEDGEFFAERGGARFTEGLQKFRSFRKSYAYGEGGWLTVELYGRDSDRDGVPETGGKFVSQNGKARLISTRHYDAAILRSTEELPARYRIEVTVSSVDFGGKIDASWTRGGKINGYDGDEVADPWRFQDGDPAPRQAITDNGVYFLCISDYARPAPHNNVFIHHHRKVVMDTDNNVNKGTSWSSVWNPLTGKAEMEGSHYAGLVWLHGDEWGSDWTGNEFLSYTPGGWKDGPIFADQYLDGGTYTFAIQRDDDGYTLSVTGRFRYGGETTYRASRAFRGPPPVWHFNRTAAEYPGETVNQVKTFGGKTLSTWPAGVGYPEYFFFGDPHINYYEGTAEFDDLKLYLPE
jgi:hypothetical protein